MKVQYINSQIDASKHDIGIVHIGLGAFHRAHQAVYLEQTLALHGGDWMIASANIRSNYSLVEQMNAAEHCYHVVEYADTSNANLREIKAIKNTFFCGSDEGREALLAQMTAPATKVVTLTVTEKGYYLAPSTGELLVGAPEIQHDMASPSQPKTALGLILESLKQRRAQGLSAFTVLSCDNMPHNGIRAKGAVVALAKGQDDEFAQWIEKNVAFPNSMVDRIVPAVSEQDLAMIKADTGIREPTVVKCEQFSQWVIEDHFPAGRPQWESAGVQMVDDVSSYEMMKLRMLNGSHSLLAYLGSIAGFKTVADAVQDKDIRAFLEHYMMQEVAPTLPSFSQTEIAIYCQQLLARFENDSLQHQLKQIAMDGSQKLPQRWLSGLTELQAQALAAPAIELGIAGWIAFLCDAEQGQQSINDPLETVLFETVNRYRDDSVSLVGTLLQRNDIFPSSLVKNEALQVRLVGLVDELLAGAKVQSLMSHIYHQE
ncbi:mannitol dehydrogenase family protein [Marinomonas foliarum]|uniref:Fructuronate reductase n=1 Tax=Marinomonas foliarum TaxID=491950 RepID=A0A369AGB5_9GAMM|nr:mannitol dehydrogenase family protein [Marinomonas foliarum]RCX08402.1 fructuronate reductase [Marinomonas foliarum]